MLTRAALPLKGWRAGNDEGAGSTRLAVPSSPTDRAWQDDTAPGAHCSHSSTAAAMSARIAAWR